MMNTVSWVLKKQPWLRLININNVSTRLMTRTNDTAFICYNTLSNCYELHSTLSFDGEGCNSCNAVIDESWLNWKIVEDYLANNHRKFSEDLQSERELLQSIYDRNEEKRQFTRTAGQLEIIKRTLGRNI